MAQHVPAATLFGVAVVFGVLGYFIRFQRRLSLVAADSGDRADRATLATFAESLSFIVAVLTALLGVAVALGLATTALWGWYTALVVASLLAAVVVNRAFHGSEGETTDD